MYSKNQFIAPKLLKGTHHLLMSLKGNDITKRAPCDDIGNVTLTAQGAGE